MPTDASPRSPGTPVPARRARRWARDRLRTPDGLALVVLVVVPALFFAVPAAVGHPDITGDNLIQNFPLRVLTGRQLREGHLPLWNPYIWSGSPLLGGLNAGSFYPFTLLFAVVAPVAAFVVNLVAVYWAGGLGLYALARTYRISPLASLLGALTYTFAGTMSGQLVHLGVVEGMAWMPLLVLAELRLSWAVFGTGPAATATAAGTDADADAGGAADTGGGASHGVWHRSSPWPWVALLALVVGLEALTGEPRAMAETEVVSAAVGLWLLLRPYAGRVVALRDRTRFFAYAVLAGAWGVALAAAELAPGWTFIRLSQRAVETYQFFGSGSLRTSWTLLLLVPDLFGGAGHFGQVAYFNSYNLPEVTGYVGLLPLGAALALLVRSFGRRRSRWAADWGMWLALGGLGLLLAWGNFTPLGHIWASIPLFGKTRLQSRNIEIVDLALAILLAFWVDRMLARRHVPGDARSWRARSRDLLPALPAAAAVLVCVITLAAPFAVEEWLHASARGAGLARQLWPWFLAEMAVAAAIGTLMWWWRRLGPRTRRHALVAVVIADIALFLLATSTAIAPHTATSGPARAAAAAVLGTDGRYAIVDTEVSHLSTLSGIGQPDLNAFTELPSVQGYGSILSQNYGTATGAHTLDTIGVCPLEEGTFGPLRLSTLLSYAGDLVRGVGPAGHPKAPASCPGVPAPGTAHRRVLYLGWPVALRSATVVVAGKISRAVVPKVGVVTPDGGTRWPAEVVRATPTGWSATFRRPQSAAGIVVLGPGRDVSDASTVSGAAGGRWAFDGVLQNAVGTSTWRFSGTFAHAFGIFRRTTPLRPPVWLASGTAGRGSSVRQLSTTDWGTTTERVVATRPVTVVWSEAYLPGWHATLVPAGAGTRAGGGSRSSARAITLTVRPDGLIQAVRVPAGTWTLTFHYRPPHLTLGLVGSFVAVAGFVAFGLAVLGARRRGRRSGPALGPPWRPPGIAPARVARADPHGAPHVPSEQDVGPPPHRPTTSEPVA